VETHDHIIGCKYAHQLSIKNKWLESFDAFLAEERYTPPIIRMIFFNQIFSLSVLDDAPIMPLPFPMNVAKAVTEQSEIGLKQLLRGRLSYQWGVIIADYLSDNNVHDKEMTPLIWGRKVVKQIFMMILSIWNKLNEDGPMLLNQKESTLTRTRLLSRIESLHQSNPNVMHHHRDFIIRPFDSIQKYSASNLCSWL
jgi:hypothetical protein